MGIVKELNYFKMIGESRNIKGDWWMIELKGTRYYQIWNKWDLWEHLLSNRNPNNGADVPPHATLWDEDLPIPTEDLDKMLEELEELRQERLHYLSYTNKQTNK